MSLKVAVQMDPIEGINIEGETTFLMMEQAQARGHALFVYTTATLALEDGRAFARGRDVLLELHAEIGREPVILQKFLPAVTQGDKRILLVDGEAVGAINRVPQKGQIRSNMAVGGTPEPVELSARDREICAAIGPE